MSAPVVIVGAGLAGLACARALAGAGREVRVLERSDGVGGRVRTDLVEGFLLDRGYQVLLAAYPEANAVLDLAALELCEYRPGALVRCEGAFHRVADPFREPGEAWSSAFNPVGSFIDKLRVLELRKRALSGSLEELRQRHEQTTEQVLRELGFSDAMLERFFRPFLGGIFLRRDLSNSSRMLDFVFRMLASGATTLPARGMGAIAAQLANALPAHCVRLNSEVATVRRDAVTLAGGERVAASAVVVATEGDVAARLLGLRNKPAALGVLNVYFAAPNSPVEGPDLVLNGEGPADGPVNVLSCPSDVAPGYAPSGQALVSVQVLEFAGDDAALERAVRAQLSGWYGAHIVERWRLLRVDRIRFAQPAQPVGALEPAARPVRIDGGLYVCGDHRDDASIDGALRSGRRAALAVLADGAR
jgi:phytoene dehydrogenase-like protein